jgi:protease IV
VVRDLVDALHRAAEDRRVVGLLARIGPANLWMAHAQEIRDALAVLRRAGKKAIACCETLGEGHSATVEYYLACAFDEIHLMPGGDLGLDGLSAQQPFLRGLLDRAGIIPRLDHRSEYKAFKYLFTEQEMVGPHREALQAVLESQARQIAEGIAAGRKIGVEAARKLMDRGPFRDVQALEAGLVDSLAYRDEVYDRTREMLKGRLLDVDVYLSRAGRPDDRGEAIALIYGVGAVSRGRSRSQRFPPGLIMGSDDVSGAFREAVKSRKIKAIIFRIDSPGGSAVASEAIWREVVRARKAGKPVIASMSNIAGSGGYYIACGADRIVAEPGTITGSIGVVTGKMVTIEAWRKLGINWDGPATGPNSGMWSRRDDFTEPQWQKLQEMLDGIYGQFKQRVAEGRNLGSEFVEQVARGRIWSGQEALQHKLIDATGGMRTAVALARELAKIPAGKGVRLVQLPRRRRFPFFGGRPESSEDTAMLAEVAELIEPAASMAAMMRERGWLRMMM